ncbi:hypothetical protein GCM10020254_26190 [Streptomyces goshikiensis]
MRRFGDTDRFLELLDTIRGKAPQAGVRSNFIVGFPGEKESDFKELERFLTHARLDAIGVFGYSDEDGTEAVTYEGKLDEDTIAERLAHMQRLAEELTSQRAEERIGETLEVLVESVESVDEDSEGAYGRAAHQAPETDGQVVFTDSTGLVPGRIVTAKVVGTLGVDLVAEPWARILRRRPDDRSPGICGGRDRPPARARREARGCGRQSGQPVEHRQHPDDGPARARAGIRPAAARQRGAMTPSGGRGRGRRSPSP